jgi:hypothetical protein
VETITALAVQQHIDAENVAICGVHKSQTATEEIVNPQILGQLIAAQDAVVMIQLSSKTNLSSPNHMQ